MLAACQGYQGVFLANSGLAAAIRTIDVTQGASEVLYAEVGKPLARVLGTGDMLNGGKIRSITPTSDMNHFGQLTVMVHLDVSPSAVLVIRLDPPGTTPSHPIRPDPCAIGRGWCYDVPPGGGRLIPRPRYFDPALATGYEYVAQANAFAGVEIPFAYGDGRFSLHSWDASAGRYVDTGREVVTGIYFDFGDQLGLAGVIRFALHGIEAPVDPDDPLGFVTGLTFVDDLNARFSMIPIVNTLPPSRVLTAVSPAKLWMGLANSDAVGLRLDVKIEVFVGSTSTPPVGSGQLNNVGSGSSGFNNALLQTVPVGLTSGPITLNPGDQLLFRVSARRTCVGTGHGSGTLRLWYNGRAHDTGAARDAATRFGATVDTTPREFYLRSEFSLETIAGTSRRSIDKFVTNRVPCGGPGRPFTSFGTWSVAP